PETRLAKKLVSALEEISVAFPSIFANDFDGERFVAVKAVDAAATRAQERHKPGRQLVYTAAPDDDTNVLIGLVQRGRHRVKTGSIELGIDKRARSARNDLARL